MIILSIEHDLLVVLDAFWCKELMSTITTCFRKNEKPKVVRILKYVV